MHAAAAQLLGLRSFRAAAVMLGGLLAYDVFWVFGSPRIIGDNVRSFPCFKLQNQMLVTVLTLGIVHLIPDSCRQEGRTDSRQPQVFSPSCLPGLSCNSSTAACQACDGHRRL
jgi:hypothetical protein